MDELKKEWYRLNAISTQGMNPRELAMHVGMKSGILKAINILAADQIIGNDKGYSLSTHEKQAEFAKKRCWCHTCRPINAMKPETMYMRLCPECGNKRCPRATNHELTCTNSNEPDQTGSIY